MRQILAEKTAGRMHGYSVLVGGALGEQAGRLGLTAASSRLWSKGELIPRFISCWASAQQLIHKD